MDEFYQQFQLGETLGEGGFGRVYRCLDKASGLILAVKTVDPSKLRNSEDKEKVENEISVSCWSHILLNC
jgi:serine/threonine protein kinase